MENLPGRSQLSEAAIGVASFAVFVAGGIALVLRAKGGRASQNETQTGRWTNISFEDIPQQSEYLADVMALAEYCKPQDTQPEQMAK